MGFGPFDAQRIRERNMTKPTAVTVTRFRTSDGTMHDTEEQAKSWERFASQKRLKMAIEDELDPVHFNSIWHLLREDEILMGHFMDDLIEVFEKKAAIVAAIIEAHNK